MQETHNLSGQLQALREQVNTVIDSCIKRLKSEADNPAITRLPGASTAFTVSSSELGRVDAWDTFSHDWTQQYRYLAELLEARRFAAARELLSGKRYIDPAKGPRRLAPEVQALAFEIVGDLDEINVL